MKDGKPAYTYNFLGLARYTVAAPEDRAARDIPVGPLPLLGELRL